MPSKYISSSDRSQKVFVYAGQLILRNIIQLRKCMTLIAYKSKYLNKLNMNIHFDMN